MLAVLLVAAGVFGVAIGSFLNVVIYRVPLKLSVVSPPSACPACGSGIRPRDNIPLVSWLLLRGRCRSCAAPISARYPVVEALAGGLLLLVGLRFGLSWSVPGEAIFVASLLALAFCDYDHLLLPKRIVWPATAAVGAALVAAAGLEGDWKRLAIAAACGAGQFALFFLINLANPRWLGFGDVRMALLLGLGVGWVGPGAVVVGYLIANAAGALAGIGLIVAGRAGRKSQLPFGVFLALGAIVAILVSPAGAGLLARY